MEQEKSNVIVIILAIILTAIIVGGGVYLWQKSELDQFKQDISDLKTKKEAVTETQEKIEKPTAEIQEKKRNNKKPFTYTDSTYKFSISFPENWGTIKRSDRDLGDSQIKDVLAVFSLESEKDPDKYFYVVVGKPALKGSEYEDAPRTFLGESGSYVYYYTASPVPVPCFEYGEELTPEKEKKYECEKWKLVWEQEIQKVILPSFKIAD